MKSIEFLNVDLEIESSESLKPIIDSFGEEVSVLFDGETSCGFTLASFEIRGLTFNRDADEIISNFCNLIENFSSNVKSIWDKCHSKKFDIGFESGNFPRSYKMEIRADTIERVAKLGVSIIVTIYPKKN